MKDRSNRDAILVFDEQNRFLANTCIQLHNGGISRVFAISEAASLKKYMEETDVSILVFGLYNAGPPSVEVISEIRTNHPDVRIVIASSIQDQNAADAFRQMGVDEYLPPPFDVTRIVTAVQALHGTAAVEESRGIVMPVRTRDPRGGTDPFSSIVTADRKMLSIFRYVEAIAPTSQAVMITGETGTGKELVARAIHTVSGRSGDFVSINVAGLDDIMFSDTLFGHGRGAFTGADKERKGLVDKAAGGTLFLDEIGELSIASQVKLLRLLQENEYYQLGTDSVIVATARVVVATNSNLEQLISSDRFRRDLYFRLCSHHIHLPALRERKNDILLLMEHFSREAAEELGRPQPQATADTVDMLMRYAFPGNIRELRGMVNNAVAVSRSGVLAFPKLQAKAPLPLEQVIPPDFSAIPGVTGRMPTLEEAEQYLIKEALRASGGNRRSAAMMLGISRQALNKRLQRDSQHIYDI